MYSIKERKRKDGSSSYQIQVKIIDYKGEEIQRAKTWKPEQVYTEKQLVIALKRIAKEFEDEITAVSNEIREFVRKLSENKK